MDSNTFTDPRDNTHVGRKFYYAIQNSDLSDAANYLTEMVQRHISLHPNNDLALQIFISSHLVSSFDLAGNLKIERLEPLEDILHTEIQRFHTEYVQYNDAVFLLVHHIMQKVNALFGLADPHAAGRMELVKQYIDQFYASQNLTVSDLSIKFDLSISYLSRTFQKAMGQKLSSYIHSVRISHAQSLLATTDFPISQIAEAVGYSSCNAFIRAYRTTEGVPPGAYRTRLQRLGDKNCF